MASHQDFMDYVCDQISGAGRITFRKMFGEYAVYCNGKVVALVCDDQLFVKPTPGGRALLGTIREGFPFPGAKPQFLITDELDDRALMTRLISITEYELPAPKPAKPRVPKAAKAARTSAPAKSTPKKPR